MTISQTVINERCNRWLADVLDSRGLPNSHDLAQHITTELLAQGLAPIPRPFPIRPTAPVASEEARRAAREAAAEAVAAAKAKRTRVGPPPTPSVEDLVAGAALLGLSHDDVATAIEQLNLPGPPVDDQLEDDVVDVVIHEADCPGGEWHVPGQPQPEPELDEPVPDTWGPDDPPF